MFEFKFEQLLQQVTNTFDKNYSIRKWKSFCHKYLLLGKVAVQTLIQTITFPVNENVIVSV